MRKPCDIVRNAQREADDVTLLLKVITQYRTANKVVINSLQFSE